jgi:hypothetical protein
MKMDVAVRVGRVHLPPRVLSSLVVLAAFTTFCQGWPLVLFGFLGHSTFFFKDVQGFFSFVFGFVFSIAFIPPRQPNKSMRPHGVRVRTSSFPTSSPVIPLVSTPKLLNFHEKINREFHGIFKNKHVHQFDYITHNFQEQKKNI